MKQKEQELVGIVTRYGDKFPSLCRTSLDISHLNLRWAYWDDNDTEHNDEDAYYTDIESLIVPQFSGELQVSLSGGFKTQPFSNLPFEDGDALAEYIYDSVVEEYSQSYPENQDLVPVIEQE